MSFPGTLYSAVEDRMTESTPARPETPAPGPGWRAAVHPALDDATRTSILTFFNDPSMDTFGRTLGLRVVDVRRGYALLELDVRPGLKQPAGVLHGGASFGLADTAVAAALRPLYGVGAVLLTIEMKINYLEPILDGVVAAEAYVVRSSRRSAYAEVDLWAHGKLAARATTTYMIRDAAPAKP